MFTPPTIQIYLCSMLELFLFAKGKEPDWPSILWDKNHQPSWSARKLQRLDADLAAKREQVEGLQRTQRVQALNVWKESWAAAI